jgi:hypothetical protein
MDDHTQIFVDDRIKVMDLAEAFARIGFHIVNRDGNLVAEPAPWGETVSERAQA